MSEHLPDCDDYAFSGAGWHPNCERICICRQVRRIEHRVRGKALRDAVEAVKALNNEKALIIDEWTTVEAVAAIRGLGRITGGSDTD